MKHAAWLLLCILCSATLLFAQDYGQQTSDQSGQQMSGAKMSGTICNSACVVQQSNAPTCDPTCTDKSGSCVFVSDKGHVMTIDNPEKAMPHMGKHVSMLATALPSEKEREQSVRIMELYEEAP